MKISGITLFTVLLAGICATAFAADDYSSLFGTDGTNRSSSSKASIPSKDGETKLELTGEHVFRYSYPLTTENNYNGLKAPYFVSDLGLQYDDRSVKFVSKWTIDLTMATNAGLDGLLLIKPQENFVSFNPDKFKFTFGYQVFAWGAADEQNPMDNINPRDYKYDYTVTKLPVLSASAVYYPFELMSVEFVFVPYRQATVFPVDPATKIPTNGNPQIIVRSPDFSLKSVITGGKINFFLTGADLSVSYLYDLDPFYTPVVTLLPGPPYMVQSIELVQKRIHRVGADVKATLDRFGLWLETCLSLSEDSAGDLANVRNHSIAWTAGFDLNLGSDNDLYFNVQYAGKYIFNYDDKFYTDYASGAFDIFQLGNRAYMERYFYRALTQNLGGETEGLLHAVIFRGEWKLFDSLLTPKVTAALLMPAMYDTAEKTRYPGYFINPEIDLMPIDSFHIVLGAYYLNAEQKTAGSSVVALNSSDLFGRLFHESSVYLQMNYKWAYTGK